MNHKKTIFFIYFVIIFCFFLKNECYSIKNKNILTYHKSNYSNKKNDNSIFSSIIIGKDTFDINNLNKTIYIHFFNIIEFNFNNLSYVNNKYRYYMKGYDNNFSNFSYKNSKSYSFLLPGKYTFIVEDSNKNTGSINIIVYSYYFYIALSLIIIIILTVFYLKFIKKINKNNKQEVQNNKNNGIVTINKRKNSVKYDKVTVLFADIQGFTKIAEQINPEVLVDELDKFFIYSDELVEKYHIEKIKTIGDAYMCAGGLPRKNSTNPIDVLLVALKMQKYMEETRHKAPDEIGFWQLRIGVHTGPVISGVIGRKKLSFDIWGDSVNIASRMESSGVPGRINISGITYQMVKDFFECEYRGKMPVKYKGEIDMYFVKGILPNLSVNGKGKEPNMTFINKLKWLRYDDLEKIIHKKLDEELSPLLKYHKKQHTIDVCTQVEIIARAEGLSSYDLILLKTAALFHDVGYVVSINNHEEHSVKIAEELLPLYNYSEKELQIIRDIILVTKRNKEPINLSQMIMKDADLDYLGRTDFIQLSNMLYEEICLNKGSMSKSKWNKMQYNFISNHVYYTNTARQLREVNRDMQIKKLKKLL